MYFSTPDSTPKRDSEQTSRPRASGPGRTITDDQHATDVTPCAPLRVTGVTSRLVRQERLGRAAIAPVVRHSPPPLERGVVRPRLFATRRPESAWRRPGSAAPTSTSPTQHQPHTNSPTPAPAPQPAPTPHQHQPHTSTTPTTPHQHQPHTTTNSPDRLDARAASADKPRSEIRWPRRPGWGHRQ